MMARFSSISVRTALASAHRPRGGLARSSGSAMFTFALVTGVKNGWLDAPTYGPAARRGWIAVVGYIDQNHDVTNVCEGTGKQNSFDYYLASNAAPATSMGRPVLWAASRSFARSHWTLDAAEKLVFCDQGTTLVVP